MPRTRLEAQKLVRRARRTRAALKTNLELPRLSVHRSLRGMYVQIIDDAAGVTLASASDAAITTGTKTERAAQVGQAIAKLALEKKITSVRFDRGSRRFHGRVAALAEAARTAGLKF